MRFISPTHCTSTTTTKIGISSRLGLRRRVARRTGGGGVMSFVILSSTTTTTTGGSIGRLTINTCRIPSTLRLLVNCRVVSVVMTVIMVVVLVDEKGEYIVNICL